MSNSLDQKKLKVVYQEFDIMIISKHQELWLIKQKVNDITRKKAGKYQELSEEPTKMWPRNREKDCEMPETIFVIWIDFF